MPEYMYRREDGSTFTMRQKFLDDPLTVDPQTGQKVVRVIQPTSVIFKGSGFYVTDSKDASKKGLTTPAENGNGHGNGANSASDTTTKASSTNGSSESSASTRSAEAAPVSTTKEAAP